MRGIRRCNKPPNFYRLRALWREREREREGERGEARDARYPCPSGFLMREVPLYGDDAAGRGEGRAH